MLPKKYRDKVRKRAEEMILLLEDRRRLELAIKLAVVLDVDAIARKTSLPKREIQPGEPVPSLDVHTLADHLRMLILKDIPALLNDIETRIKTTNSMEDDIN